MHWRRPMFRLTMATMAFATLAGCTDGSQTITGHVTAGSFPEPIVEVRATGTHGVTAARVLADGSFMLTLPADDDYRIEMMSAVRSPDLVYPRAGGTVDTTLYVADGGPAFDLGGVRYIKDQEGVLIADTAVPDNAPADGEGGGTGPGDT